MVATVTKTAPATGPRLYVYYRVGEGDLLPTADAVRRLQRHLCAGFAGLRGELLRRPGASGGVVTLMECYYGAADMPALPQALDAAARDAGLPQPRHVELFVALD